MPHDQTLGQLWVAEMRLWVDLGIVERLWVVDGVHWISPRIKRLDRLLWSVQRPNVLFVD